MVFVRSPTYVAWPNGLQGYSPLVILCIIEPFLGNLDVQRVGGLELLHVLVDDLPEPICAFSMLCDDIEAGRAKSAAWRHRREVVGCVWWRWKILTSTRLCGFAEEVQKKSEWRFGLDRCARKL